jgi:hypothetical protein
MQSAAKVCYPPFRAACHFRPFADIDHAFPMLRCGPSKRPFVHGAAFLLVETSLCGQSGHQDLHAERPLLHYA